MSHGYFAFDIERTGQSLTDVTFAVGFAMSGGTLRSDSPSLDCTHDTSTHNKSTWNILAVGAPHAADIKSASIALKLRTDDEIARGDTWEEIWISRGWEMRCYHEFWSKHLCMLNTLQDPSSVNLTTNPDDIPKFINDQLLIAEGLYPDNLHLVTDTVAFDTVFVSLLLLSHGYKELCSTRDGKYRWGYEIDSYAMGAMRCTPETDWNTLQLKLSESVYKRSRTFGNTHNPEQDAQFILAKFLDIREYCDTHE